MFHMFKLLVFVMLLILPLSSLKTDNERDNKWRLSSWITPLKIGLIGGLLYGSAKHLRPVFLFADSGSHFTPTVHNAGYHILPYPLTLQPLIVPGTPISQIPFTDYNTCLYGKANGCRQFHRQGGNREWELPGHVRQEPIPERLRTPISQQVEQDAGINFIPLNTAFKNTHGTNVHFRHNVRNFTPNKPGSSRKTEPVTDLNGNIFTPILSTTTVNPFLSIPLGNTNKHNSSTVVSFGNFQMQDPRRYFTILTNTSTDSLESTPKPS